MVKHSIIVSCDYEQSYELPNKSIIYYHRLVLVNGDTANCGTTEKYPERLSVGRYIYYRLVDNRIKLISKSEYDQALTSKND